MDSSTIRELDPAKDLPALRARAVELQEFERQIDPRLPEGEKIADAYLERIFQRCGEFDGRVLVADCGECGAQVVGYVEIWLRYHSDDLEDDPTEHAHIPDLAVNPAHRGRGIGRALLRAAESLARDAGASSLRIDVMASNVVAKSLYLSEGFGEAYLSLEKRFDK